MKTKEHGVVKAEYVFIPGDFPLSVFCVIRLEMVPFTRESTAMISLNIFRDIMASCRENTRISNLFAKQFLRNISLALNEA